MLQRLERHPRWTFHFGSNSVFWPDAIEGFFAILTKRGLLESRARQPPPFPPLAPRRVLVHIGSGRLAKDVPLANRVRSGRKQP